MRGRDDDVESRQYVMAVPAWGYFIVALVSLCLCVWAAWSSVGFFSRGLSGDASAGIATTLLAIMLLAAFVFFVRLAAHGQLEARLRRLILRAIALVALPVAAVTSWSALCFLWDGLVRLNHDYLHWGEFGTYTRAEGSTPLSEMLSSLVASGVLGVVSVFLFWYSARRLRSQPAKSVETKSSANPYNWPGPAG